MDISSFKNTQALRKDNKRASSEKMHDMAGVQESQFGILANDFKSPRASYINQKCDNAPEHFWVYLKNKTENSPVQLHFVLKSSELRLNFSNVLTTKWMILIFVTFKQQIWE